VRDDAELCKVVDNVALLAEPVIQVILTVIAVPRPFDPAADLCPIGKFDGDLGGVLPGVKVNEIGEFLGTQVAGTRKGENKKDRIDDIALPGAVRA
jgi:hypothetical protein